MCAMQNEVRDKTTFAYAELPQGATAAEAYAVVTSNMLRHYRGSPHYEALLEAFAETLLDGPQGTMSEAVLRNVDVLLSDRLNALLKKERDSDKTRKQKWAPMAPRRAHVDESSDDDSDAGGGGVEDAEARAERERLEQERLEEEWRKSNERYEALQRQREENAAKLRARARQVDTSALAEKLRSGGVVLLNAGAAADTVASITGGGGGAARKKQTAASQQAMEAVDKLKRDVAEAMKAKERLRTVLQTSDEELPASIAAARRELHELQQQQQAEASRQSNDGGNNDDATSTSRGGSSSSSALSKGQMAQLQQKLSKQGLERDRLALQVKALPANAQRDELLELLQQRDSIAVDLEMAAAQRSA